MPTYCYRTEDGWVHQIFMTAKGMARRERKDGSITLDDGRKAKRDMRFEWGGRSKIQGWPMECNASGVLPEQIKETQAEMSEAGAYCDFNPVTGCAIYTDRAHRNECLRARQFYDRSAGYSDPEPVNMRRH
jgi:hypothetical protein